MGDLVCKRCDHSWVAKEGKEPACCPKCKSNRWNKERVRIKFELGTRYGRLVAIAREGNVVTCVCDCGQEKQVGVANLQNKARGTRSCGCLRSEVLKVVRLKHGATVKGVRTPTYRIWLHIMSRCNNPKSNIYRFYGGRGIKVCERWKASYEDFLADMGEKPEGLSIERKNNDLGYFPDNCVWATKKEQARNRRSNRRVTLNGETKIMIEWIEILGLNYHTVYSRLRRGLSAEEALCK